MIRERERERERAISYADADLDGWNDVWVAKYPEAPRDITSDSNGDGTPNFIEMMLNLDPFAKPTPIPPTDPQAAEKLENRRADSRKRNGLALAPFLNDGIRDSKGNPATRVDLKAESLKRSRDLGIRLKRKQGARNVRIAAYLKGAGAHLTAAERAQLYNVVDGEPRFRTSLSHDQAVRTGVQQLWPGGFSNTNLTGMGQTVAMWDAGGVAASHEQFGTGRIDNTNAGLPDEHATAVATVIIGKGDPTDNDLTDFTPFGTTTIYPSPDSAMNNARGMAYQANIRAYNLVMELEMLRGLAEQALAGTEDIVFSNHAYGTDCGYRRLPADRSIPPDPDDPWKWYGDPNLGNGTSDYKHGFYLSDPCRDIDDIVDANKVFLPIWSAGNEDRNFELTETPEPEEAGAAFSIAHKVLQTGTTYTEANAPARNGDWTSDGFINADNNLLPEACSKNVLTVGEQDSGSEGPTDDLRLKPDIVSVAPGLQNLSIGALHVGNSNYRQLEGSSFAAASVTGGMALIRQRWLQLNGGSAPVLASTWKGLAIATAGGANYASDGFFKSGGSRPTAESGYGLFDPMDAVHIIEEDFAGRSAGTSARIIEIQLKTGDQAMFNIRCADPFALDNFRVAICWTDPKGQALTRSLDPREPVLVNDIDLRILRPGDTEETDLEPWMLTTLSDDEFDPDYRRLRSSTTGDNIRDNVEVVDSDPFYSDSVEYTVKITRKPNQNNTDPQLVSIIIVGDAEAVLRPFRIVGFSQTDQNNPAIYGVTWLSIPGAIYQIESSSDLASWQPLQNEISAIGDKTTTELNMAGMGDRKFVRVRRLD